MKRSILLPGMARCAADQTGFRQSPIELPRPTVARPSNNHEETTTSSSITRRRLPAVLTLAAALAITLLFATLAHAVVTPAPDRAFGTNAAGTNILAQMQAEAGNPLVAGSVVHFINNDLVDVVNPTTGQTNRFEHWTGILITPEWVLTCAHTLQGSDGRGAGVNPADIFYNFGGSTIPNPATAAIAEVHLHPSWTLESYEKGNDLALVRLAVPVAGVATFPRLSASSFAGASGVVIAGYGEQGTGTNGGNGLPGRSLAVGVNSLDALGGQPMTYGDGSANTQFAAWPASVAFMDFDKWEHQPFPCVNPMNVPFTNAQTVALTAFSTMGENESTRGVQACPSPIQAAPGVFAATICDFFPGGGDSGGPAFLWPASPNLPVNGFFLTGTPTLHGVVSYRSRGNQTNATSIYGNVAAYTLIQPHLGWIYQTAREVAALDSDRDGRTDEAEFLAGTDPYRAPLASATYVPRPLDVNLQNIRIVQERPVGANETELEFTADLRNTDSGRYFELSLNVDRAGLPATASVVDAQLNYATLSESGTAVAGAAETLVIRVANADLAAVRQSVLNGQILEVTAFEEQVYSGPTKFIDAPTDHAFEGTTGNVLGQLVLVFTNETDLISGLVHGDLLIADTAAGGYDPKQPSPTAPFAIPFLSQQIPFEIASVSVVGGRVHVAGHKRDLNEILKSGTFLASDENFNGGRRALLDPPVENTYTEEEKADRKTQADILRELDPTDSRLADLGGMNAIPWHFNDVEITKHLRLSGQVMLRSSGLRFQVSFRNFALKRASVGIDAGLVASLVLETTGTNNNVSVPLADKQKELARIPLPGIPITIAGIPCTIAPAFVLAVGAEANAPGGLSIPLETSINVGAEIGWVNGQTFATPIKEFAAPHVSDPTVFDAVAANAKAWAEARFEVNLSVAGGLASAGPSLAIRAEAGFEVAPFNNPWWTLDAGADLVGRFEMRLLGFNVAGVETSLPVANFFHRDAGGPLIPAPLFAAASAGAGAGGAPADIGPKAGRNTRWGLAFAAPNSNASASYSKGFVTPLSGGGCFVGGSSAIPSFLGVISADGNTKWMQTFPTGEKPVDGAQLPDGSVMVAGYRGFDWWLARYDTNGVRLWSRSYRASADLRKLAVGFAANGDPEFYLAGYQSLVIVTQSDPVVWKLDKEGGLVWTKVYALPGDDEVSSIRVLRDGNLLLTGDTDWNVGTDPFIGANNNGLVMKLTPAGDLVWAKAVPARWGMQFNDAAEAPDGTLYLVGSNGDLVWNYYPSILVARFSAEGELIDHVSIGEDADWTDELPDGGDTPYDYAAQVTWTSNGLIVVGTTGLGGTATAWAANLTDELGVRWFSAFDGPRATGFLNVAATDSGIMAMGWADDIWPTKFAHRTAAWLLSLPWEGLMRFHPDTGAQSHYLQPRVSLSSAHSHFIATITDAQQRVTVVPTADVPFVVSNTVPAVSANIAAGVATTFDTARLERLEPSVLDSYEEWAAYHQMTGTNSTATGDSDGDGIENGTEFFFGTSPLVSETNAPPSLSIQYDPGANTVAIDFDRALAAIHQPFVLQYSTNLTTWRPASAVLLEHLGSFDLLERLRLTLPVPAPDAAFFRMEIPITP